MMDIGTVRDDPENPPASARRRAQVGVCPPPKDICLCRNLHDSRLGLMESNFVLMT
jgi:hypothetical protein